MRRKGVNLNKHGEYVLVLERLNLVWVALTVTGHDLAAATSAERAPKAIAFLLLIKWKTF